MNKLLLLASLVLYCMQAFSQVPWETEFADDFNRADGEMGTNYETQALYGTLAISNNQVLATPNGSETMYWAATYEGDIDNTNLKLSIDFIATKNDPTDETKYAVMARGGGSTAFSYGAGISSYDNTVAISEFDETGIQNILAGDSFEILADSIYNVEFILMGAELEMTVTEVYSGDQITLNYTDPTPLDGTSISINGLQGGSELVYFDNFQIDTVADNFGIEKLGELNAKINLFPNPANDILNVSIERKKANTCVIQLLSMDGRIVYETEIAKHTNSLAIPVNQLSKGIYTVRVKTESKNKTLIFVKE